MNNTKRTWVEINLDALRHNMQIIRNFTAPSAQIMAVVKADAYGHGVNEIADTLLKCGATWLAVSMLDEAIEIRNMGIQAPILILSDNEPECADIIVQMDIRQGVYSLETAKILSDAAVKANKIVKIHIKIDSGMGRVGFLPEEAPDMVEKISKLPNLEIEGIFTHFAVADESDEKSEAYTRMQFSTFYNVCEKIEKEKNIKIKLRHVCNSAGILKYPEMHLDMVRAGIILYGLWPSDDMKRYNADFKAVMRLKSAVSHIKKVQSGASISYGCTYTTERETTVATIPVGYADGYMRFLSNKGYVYHEKSGTVLPIIGRICMDQMMVKADEAADSIKPGDTVVLFGDYEKNMPTAEEIAKLIGTINYEIICAVSRRVPKFYIESGNLIKVANRLTDKK